MDWKAADSVWKLKPKVVYTVAVLLFPWGVLSLGPLTPSLLEPPVYSCPAVF